MYWSLLYTTALLHTAHSINTFRECGYTGAKEECLPCTEVGTIYSSIVISLHTTADPEECRAHCQLETRCHFFSIDRRRESCHLKTSVGTKLRAPSSYVSGPKYCSKENEIYDDTTSAVEVFTPPAVENAPKSLENAANSLPERAGKDDPRESRVLALEKKNGTYPVVAIQHTADYQTLLAAIPANFGLKIKDSTKISGKAVLSSPLELCDYSPSETRKKLVQIRMDLDPKLKLFGVVKRGLCSFSTKAENAVSAGYEGMVVLDNMDNTSVQYIHGNNKAKLKEFPIVFLKKEEAIILENIINDSQDLVTISIQDSSSVDWYRLNDSSTSNTSIPSTTSVSSSSSILASLSPPPPPTRSALPSTTSNTARTSTLSKQTIPAVKTTPQPVSLEQTLKIEEGKFMIGMKRPAIRFPYYFWRKNTTIETTTPSAGTNSVGLFGTNRSILHLTPLALGSIIGGLVLVVLLLFSVLTLIISKIRQHSRKRRNHSRCQQALSQLSAGGKNRGTDNVGFDSTTTEIPKSVKYLAECPVCLDFAANRKIFQCREGHIVCEVCFGNPDLQTCPICRINIKGPNQVSRNRQLEELVSALIQADRDQDGGTTPSAPFPTTPHAAPRPKPSSSTTVAVIENRDLDGEDSHEEVDGLDEVESPYLPLSVDSRPLTVLLPPEPRR